MMIITQTDDIFLKRQKRIKKINDDRGSSDSSNQIIEKQYVQNDQSILNNLDWSDLIIGNVDNDTKEQKQETISYSSEEYYIYGDDRDKKADNFLRKISSLTSQLSMELIFSREQNEKEVSYLVLDFDDLDREEVMQQYKKISNKENISHHHDYIMHSEQKSRLTNKIKSLIDKKPLSSSIHVSLMDHSQANQLKNNHENVNLLLGSREERDQQLKIMKKSFQQLDKKNKSSNRKEIIVQEKGRQQSALYQFMTQSKQSNPTFLKKEENRSQIFDHHLKMDQKIKNVYGRPLMKQSEMLPNSQMAPKFKSTKEVNIIYQDLNYVKQAPLQFPGKVQMKKDKQRFRLPQGLIKKQKQVKFEEFGSNNQNNHFMIHPVDGKITNIKEPETRVKRVKSGGHLKYSPDRGWYQQYKEIRDR